jgi:hypothetical protein
VTTNRHLYTELIIIIITTTNIINDAITVSDAGIYGVGPYLLPKGGGYLRQSRSR